MLSIEEAIVESCGAVHARLTRSSRASPTSAGEKYSSLLIACREMDECVLAKSVTRRIRFPSARGIEFSNE